MLPQIHPKKKRKLMNVTEQGLWAREIEKAHQSHIFHWTAAHFR